MKMRLCSHVSFVAQLFRDQYDCLMTTLAHLYNLVGIGIAGLLDPILSVLLFCRDCAISGRAAARG